jgi:hypothetical protein
MQTNNMPSLQPPWPEETIYASSGGTSLVFDKSALESLNIHEAALAEEVAGWRGREELEDDCCVRDHIRWTAECLRLGNEVDLTPELWEAVSGPEQICVFSFW